MKRFANYTGTVTLMLFFLAAFSAGDSRAKSTGDTQEGIVQVIVRDTSGHFIPDAPIYMDTGRHLHYLESQQSGAIRIRVPTGEYILSSARTQRSGDSIDRFASPEALVHVDAGDTVTVFLTLYPLGDFLPPISLSSLHNMGITDELAKNVNY